MPKVNVWILCVLATCASGALSAPQDDIVLLENGDRISGAITSINGGNIRIATPYAGELTIQLDAVAAIETNSPRALALSEGHRLVGALTQEDGVSGIRTDDGFHPAQPLEVIALAEDTETLHQLLHPPAPSKWSGTVEAGLALRSGNTDTTDFKFAAGVKRTGDRNTLALNFEAAYGSSDNILNTRRFQGTFRWQYYLRERLYLYTIGLAERDDGRKLEHRLQGGGGLGYDIIKRENRTLSGDLGVTYTREQWAPFTPWERDQTRNAIRGGAYNRLYAAIAAFGENDGQPLRKTIEQVRHILADIRYPLREYNKRNEAYANLRIGVNYSQRIFRASTLSEELVLMPNLEDIGEFRAVSELALTTPVTDTLSLRTSLKTEYDSLAKERGVDRWDNTLMTQIRYKF